MPRRSNRVYDLWSVVVDEDADDPHDKYRTEHAHHEDCDRWDSDEIGRPTGDSTERGLYELPADALTCECLPDGVLDHAQEVTS